MRRLDCDAGAVPRAVSGRGHRQLLRRTVRLRAPSRGSSRRGPRRGLCRSLLRRPRWRERRAGGGRDGSAVLRRPGCRRGLRGPVAVSGGGAGQHRGAGAGGLRAYQVAPLRSLLVTGGLMSVRLRVLAAAGVVPAAVPAPLAVLLLPLAALAVIVTALSLLILRIVLLGLVPRIHVEALLDVHVYVLVVVPVAVLSALQGSGSRVSAIQNKEPHMQKRSPARRRLRSRPGRSHHRGSQRCPHPGPPRRHR
jgi:hypothetical protein